VLTAHSNHPARRRTVASWKSPVAGSPHSYRPKTCLIASAFSWTALLARLMKIGIATINSKPITIRGRLMRPLRRLPLEWPGLCLLSIRLPIAHPEHESPVAAPMFAFDIGGSSLVGRLSHWTLPSLHGCVTPTPKPRGGLEMTKWILAAVLAFTATTASAQYTGTGSNQSSHPVQGYTAPNGTYVPPHQQTNPNSTQTDNYGTRGNVNPYTGAVGTRTPKY